MKNSYLQRASLFLLLFISLGTCVRAQICDLGTNDWEGSSNANPPEGWTRGGGSPDIRAPTSGEQDGLAVGFNTVGEFVTSPALTCVGSVGFDWHASGGTSVFTVEVQWSQTPDDETSWQTFGSVSAVATGGAAQRLFMPATADLPEASAVAPFNIFVRWIMTQRSGGTAYIDNICFDSGSCTVQPTETSFTAVPSACIQVGSPFTVEVCATDANGFVADTYAGSLSLSSSGAVSGTGSMATTNGCATYQLTATAAGPFTLTVSASGLGTDQVALEAVELCPREEILRVISYNLLNFPNGRFSCEDPDDINLPNRQDTLAKVMAYLNPDVLMVCELQTAAGSAAILQALQTLNPDFRAATFVENQSSTVKDLNNMLYYNSAKMTLVGQEPIETNTRDISRYEMRMNDPQIATATDTVFVDFYVAHLKAGGATTDRQRRADDVAIFQAYFDGLPLRNSVIGGDMNFYESSEVAYQTMLNSTANPWFDPAMAPGSWDVNASFADLHTQSAREFGSQSYDCGISGGIDSRFDFLLMNGPIQSETDFVEYIDGSYEVAGNDGGLFNRSINDPSNTSGVPFSVLDAMFFMSDHLPVMMDIKVSYPLQALPVTLLSFEAQATANKSVDLRWTTTVEEGFSHYEIERLVGRGNWHSIGRVSGGNEDYTFTDRAPEAGLNHYRLRMIDLDGSTAFSRVVSVSFAGALRLYPTVTTGDIRVVGEAITRARVIDAHGRSREVAVGPGGRLSLAGMAAGWYVVGVWTDEGQWSYGRVLLR